MSNTSTQETNETVARQLSDEIAVSLENLNKWYGQFHVLKGINFEVKKGERTIGFRKIYDDPMHKSV